MEQISTKATMKNIAILFLASLLSGCYAVYGSRIERISFGEWFSGYVVGLIFCLVLMGIIGLINLFSKDDKEK